MAEKLHQIGRLAYRVEGPQWNVYWALPNTMHSRLSRRPNANTNSWASSETAFLICLNSTGAFDLSGRSQKAE